MRHGKADNHLGRTSQHRKALLMNLANSLILHKRITTTVAKAKELRKYVEPLITRSKDDSTHSRRITFSYLRDKEAVKELYGPVADKVSDRNGGYTRIIKTGFRLGDNADMCIVELVDFNTVYGGTAEKDTAAKKRTRRGKSAVAKTAEATAPAIEAAAPAVEDETPAVDTAAEDTSSNDAPATETSSEEEAPKAE